MIPEIVIAQLEHARDEIQSKLDRPSARHICIVLITLCADDAREYLKQNYPSKTQHTKFYNHPTFSKDGDIDTSWWCPRQADDYAKNPFLLCNKQRIQFLNHLIKQLKKKPYVLE